MPIQIVYSTLVPISLIPALVAASVSFPQRAGATSPCDLHAMTAYLGSTPEGATPTAQHPVYFGSDGSWGVSPLWGQQAIGADLAAEFVRFELKSNSARLVPTGIVDQLSQFTPNAPLAKNALLRGLTRAQDFPEHGDSVSRLIDTPPFGSSPAVVWTARIHPGRNGGSDQRSIWDQHFQNDLKQLMLSPTKIVNASIGFEASKVKDAIDAFVASGRVLVQASGNHYPMPSWGGFTARLGHIVVGSVGPNGFPTPSSAEPVKIYAPADSVQLSGPNGERFGGTSGSAPLVTGSLVNVLALVPDLSNEELELLLQVTSLPAYAQKAAKHGPGILNSYRVVYAAKCLATKRVSRKVRLRVLRLMAQRGVDQIGCFDFTSKAKALVKEADGTTTCSGRQQGLRLLRSAFLLKPTRDLALRIAALYNEHGIIGDARWYQTLAASLGTPEEQRAHFISLLDEPSLTKHRYYAGTRSGMVSRGAYAMSLASRLPLNHEFVTLAQQHLVSLISQVDRERQIEAVEKGLFLGPRALPALAPVLVHSEDWYNEPRSRERIQNTMTLPGEPEFRNHPWALEAEAFFRQ